MSERRSTENIISDWKFACGQEKTSDQGTTYIVVPIADRRGNFLRLIQTMVDEGLTQQEVGSVSISNSVVLTCWSDLIIKMTAKELKKARDITRAQWQEAIKEFFAKPISEYIGPKRESTTYIKPEPKEEKVLEVDPSDRIKMDTSDIKDPDLDLDFLKDLGIQELPMGDKK